MRQPRRMSTRGSGLHSVMSWPVGVETIASGTDGLASYLRFAMASDDKNYEGTSVGTAVAPPLKRCLTLTRASLRNAQEDERVYGRVQRQRRFLTNSPVRSTR